MACLPIDRVYDNRRRISILQDSLDHEYLGLYEGRRSGVRVAIAIHSGGRSGISLGGCRIAAYPGPDEHAAEALAAGEDPKQVWRAVWAVLELPPVDR